MRPSILLSRRPLVAAGMIAAGSVAACAHPSRISDAQHNDYHQWNSHEQAAYRTWEGDQHLQHVDYGRRSAGEQSQYWSWRHDHPDR